MPSLVPRGPVHRCAERAQADFDVADLASPEVRRQVIETLEAGQPWYDSAETRLEVVQRAALWRRLTGDRGFQLEYWLGRLENHAGPQLVDLLPSAAGR
jgi:hypothetical protein